SLLFSLPPPSSAYTLSLHDALPIFNRDPEIRQILDELRTRGGAAERLVFSAERARGLQNEAFDLPALRARGYAYERLDQLTMELDRKSTRLNSSHQIISYALFCLQK